MKEQGFELLNRFHPQLWLFMFKRGSAVMKVYRITAAASSEKTAETRIHNLVIFFLSSSLVTA